MSKTFDELREGFKTDANRKAAFAKMNDKKTSEALSPAQKAAREKSRIGPKGEVGKREYGSDKAKRSFHQAQRGVSGKGDNRNTMSIFDRQPRNVKPKGKLPEGTVNELDTSTLISYRKKANKQRFSSNKKTAQRTTGVDMANKKLRKRNIDKFGKHSPKGVDKMGNPKEDSDAVKAFLAKGGKIKKLPPAKAQGYHGRDDPGKGMHGMMDKPDTKAMGTRKKVKSMESLWDNIRKRRAAGKPRLKPGDKNYPKTLNVGENYQVQKYTDGKKDGPPKSFGGDLKKATAHAKKQGGDHRVHKEMISTSSGPFGINPKVGVKVMKKGKEVPPTPPKIGVVSYTGGKKDKPNEGYKSYAQQKAVWASRADAKKKGKK